MKYTKLSVTVDVAIFTIQDNDLKVLLIKRNLEPFRGFWALPGGFVRDKENLDEAAKRELEEETGVKNVYLEQLYSFGEVGRDPRGKIITIAYMALVNYDRVNVKATTDASDAQWFPVSKLPKLAFDHDKILSYALKRLRWKFEYTAVAFSLLPRKFAISEIQRIYEIVFNKGFDKRNFAKKILSLNIIREEGVKRDVSHRPPMLYSLKKDIGQIIEIL
ncbi:NUDIX hydrolase [Candidatus Pacearchaeota archaeon]|nr:NUDIX hydrolase [Candidatus Pacearchaeota archaeon]